jgi:peptide/nickel transport system substrate-binding protein
MARTIPRVLFLLSAALATLLCLDSAATWAATKKIMRVAFREPEHLDCHTNRTGQGHATIPLLYNALVRFKPGTIDIEPDVAERWEHSPDGLQWTFYLRKGVQFHKGFGEVKADDVVFSFKRVLDPKTGAPMRNIVEIIKEVKALDDSTVQMTIEHPDAAFLMRLTHHRSGCIYSKKALEKYGPDAPWNPIGTGPFLFKEHAPQQKVVFVANEQYFRGRPKIDEVHYYNVPEIATILLGMEKGEFDLTRITGPANAPYEALKKAGMVIDVAGFGGFMGLYLRNDREPFNDIRVRQAIFHALNRDEITQTIMGPVGQRWDSPVPDSFFGYTSEGLPHYEYDPVLAKKLLAEAGHSQGLQLRTWISNRQDYNKTMVMIQEQLKQVGIELKIDVAEHAKFHDYNLKNLQPHMALVGGVELPHAQLWLDERFNSKALPPGSNFSNYKDPQVDQWLNEARGELDPEKQQMLYAEIQRKILADAAFVPIYNYKLFLARNPRVKLNYQEGSVLNWFYTSIADMDIQE